LVSISPGDWVFTGKGRFRLFSFSSNYLIYYGNSAFGGSGRIIWVHNTCLIGKVSSF